MGEESKRTRSPRIRLACQSCRRRRRKCNFETPCSNCVKYKTECVPSKQDLRRSRCSSAYVKAMEQHIQNLEDALRQVKEADNMERVSKIRIPEPLPFDESAEPSLDMQRGTNFSTVLGTKPSVGTTSIYPTNSLTITKKKASTEQQQLHVNLKNMSRSPFVLRSLSLFFKWLYPAHYMFIHRETFLSSFFGDVSTKSYYCSEELVFAIAALGSRLASKEDELYRWSKEYYQRAKNIVLKKVFQLEDASLAESTSSSKLAIIQTLLCLAFYDIGAGENPLAWYLAGLAFRMAHEIGLHLNPATWNDVYEDKLSQIDFEVRSRIYWGCYLADHLISILFGRSTTLQLSNSTVPETDELPDIETGIEDYIYDPDTVLSMANPLKRLIVLSRITEVFASKLFAHTEPMLMRTGNLSKFNLEMYNWRRDLPKELQWTKSSIKDMKKFIPTTAYIWFHYYIVLISYNKPFMYEVRQSRNLIEESIEELNHLIESWTRSFKTFEKCNIYMVYSAILAIQCMDTNLISKDFKHDFEKFLKSPSLNYDLAHKFIDREYSEEPTNLLGSLSYGNDFALEYNFDFTLLNEIDTLIGTKSGVP